MRRTSVSIGILRVSVLLTAALWAGTVSADVSPSYTLVNDFPNTATNNGGSSTSFILAEGQQTWNQKPLSGTNYQIVLPGGGYGSTSSSSTSSSSSSSSSVSGGGEAASSSSSRPTGSRGDRAGSSASASFSRSSSSPSSSSSSSSITPDHGAASSDAEGTASSESGVIEPQNGVTLVEGITAAEKPQFVYWSAARYCSVRDAEVLSFFGSHEAVCKLHASAVRLTDAGLRLSLTFLWLLLILLLICVGLCAHLMARKRKNSLAKAILRSVGYICHFIAMLLIIFSLVGIVHAAQTTPNTHVYNGRLLDSSGNAVTSSTSIRFSYWKSVDFTGTDITGAGTINTSATNYAGWQETHTITPNSSGYFSVTLGSSNALPDFSTLPTQTLLSLFLQVDVKPAASVDTAYELLDPDSTDTALDRSGVLSVPFAENADMIDQREIGTGSGNIAILNANGQLPVSTVPNGTNTSSFTLDADNSEISEIVLTFGAALEKKLTYDISDGTFRFNDDVEVQGNLTVTGLINGVNITSLQSSTDALKAFSGGGLNLSVSMGSYRLNGVVTNYAGGIISLPSSATNSVFFGSGGLAYAAAFPTDESFIPVAAVTTSAGSIVTVLDRRTLSSDDREHTTAITFNPGFEKASYQADGADNVGQLSVSHDNISLKNFYVWTSTKSSLQDYDIILRVPVPEHFVRWNVSGTANPISLMYRSTSAVAANNKLDIQIYDTNGVPVTLSGSVSNLSGTSWATSQVEFTGNPTWTVGQDMLMRLKLSAKDAYQMHIGSLKMNFVELE